MRGITVLTGTLLAVLLFALLSVTTEKSPANATVRAASGSLGFGVTCDPAVLHDNFDPILGLANGHSHAHSFFGGTNIKKGVSVTSSDLRSSNSTTCALSADKAAYWLPKANSSVQTEVNYYQPKPGNDNTAYNTIPANLEMIAGSVPANGRANVSPHLHFGCQDAVATASRPVDCGTSRAKVAIDFPDCVERNRAGQLIQKSKNGRSHVHYSDNAGNCGGNSLKIPQLKVHVIYQEHNGNAIRWSVPFYDLHADFMNGWNQTVLKHVIDLCINGAHSGCQRLGG